MSLETDLKQQLLEHLMTERQEVELTCEQCKATWDIAGPFELVIAFACPACGKAGMIQLVRQVEGMVANVMNQFESRIAEQYMERAARYGAAAGPAPTRQPAAHGAGCGSHGGDCC